MIRFSIQLRCSCAYTIGVYSTGLAGERHMRLVWCGGCAGLYNKGTCATEGKKRALACCSAAFSLKGDERNASVTLSLTTASKDGNHSPGTNVPRKSPFCKTTVGYGSTLHDPPRAYGMCRSRRCELQGSRGFGLPSGVQRERVIQSSREGEDAVN